ncbi:MAG: DUF4167 domain-containing protein [Acetobacteraceae bacterium]
MRQHGGGVPLNRNHVFDSNGPDLRIRGTSQQLFEKYLQLGRDATTGGDRVLAESYFQHADHYFRIMNAMNQAQQGPMSPQQVPPSRYQGERDGVDAELADGEPAGIGDQPEEDDAREIPIGTQPAEGHPNGPQN